MFHAGQLVTFHDQLKWASNSSKPQQLQQQQGKRCNALCIDSTGRFAVLDARQSQSKLQPRQTSGIQLADLTTPGAASCGLSGVQGSSRCCAVANVDGKALVLAGNTAGEVLLWKDTGAAQQEILRQAGGGDDGEVSCCCISSDSQYAAAGVGQVLLVWHVQDARLCAELHSSDKVTCCAFSHDGGKAAWGCADGTIRLWDLTKEVEQPVEVRSPRATQMCSPLPPGGMRSWYAVPHVTAAPAAENRHCALATGADGTTRVL
jgi:WD40 repeat protein